MNYLRVYQHNIHYYANKKEELQELITREKYDVLFLNEVCNSVKSSMYLGSKDFIVPNYIHLLGMLGRAAILIKDTLLVTNKQ